MRRKSPSFSRFKGFLLWIARSSVSSSDSICQIAARRYGVIFEPTDSLRYTTVLVLQIGDSGYVVTQGTEVGRTLIYYYFDVNWVWRGGSERPPSPALSPVSRADAAGSRSAGNCLQWALLTEDMLAHVRTLVHPASGPDAAEITKFQSFRRIPILDSSVVSVATSGSICQIAARRYAVIFEPTDSLKYTTVLVLQIGDRGYVVTRGSWVGRTLIYYYFDRNWVWRGGSVRPPSSSVMPFLVPDRRYGIDRRLAPRGNNAREH
jgi:hypothetical protein